MNDLQKKILYIAQYFDYLCKKNHITYYLMGGSALGAIRHKGFIPWDDDYDVFVPYGDYLRLLEIIKDQEKFDNKNFCFQKRNTIDNLPFIDKIRLKNTLLIEDNCVFNPNKCNGIYMDIMILIKAPNNFFKRIKQFLFAKILIANQLAKTGYKTSSRLRRIMIRLSSRKIAKNGQKRYLDYIFSFENNVQFSHYCHLFGRASFFHSYYSKKIFDNTIYVPFENAQFPIMSGYDEYLKKRFGKKYSDMPSKKTIDSFPKHTSYYNCYSDKDERNVLKRN